MGRRKRDFKGGWFSRSFPQMGHLPILTAGIVCNFIALIIVNCVLPDVKGGGGWWRLGGISGFELITSNNMLLSWDFNSLVGVIFFNLRFCSR